MKRRQFLRNLTVAGSLAPLMLHGYSVQAFQEHPISDLLIHSECDDRVLVLVQLNGGNDGLNTVIPIDQYGLYKSARGSIAIPEESILKISDATGLHPQMQGMQSLFKDGKLRVLQDVGYPIPNFSHFRSTDIWLTGSDTEEYINTGWLGRYLDTRFPNYPDVYPNPEMSDPLAIQIGSVLSLGFEGPNANMAMAFTDPNSYYNIVDGTGNQANTTRADIELAYIRKIGEQLQKFANPVKNAASKAKNLSKLYPAIRTNPLADQLKIVAQLIAGGLKSKVYMVSLTGFDTHANQLQGGNGTPVPHGTLLQQVSIAIQAFMDDCSLLGIEDRVLGMTFSEFGRRIKVNSSSGTDHGAAGPVFLFGSSVESGIHGHNPIIPQDPGPDDNIPMQTDFRSLYASILKQWFCVPPSELKKITIHDFAYDIPIVKNGVSNIAELGIQDESFVTISPSPVNSQAIIAWNASFPISRITLYNNIGSYIGTLADSFTYHQTEISIRVDHLPKGYYIVQLSSIHGNILSKSLIIQ